MRFQIVRHPIDAAPLLDPRAGASVVFEGRVRNHNEGASVERLEYEAYDELAVAEGDAVLAEALARFPILAAVAVHRVGALEIGDVAVRVEVAAAHRGEAFEACAWIIDEVKARVPIWKKEHYADGAAGWIHADSPPSSLAETDYYARQVALPGFGPEGQARLGKASVLVVGVGGLGCAMLPYLASAGVGRIVLVDPDQVEGSNLHRQVLFGPADIGRLKVEVACDRLKALNPFVAVESRPERLDAANADALVAGMDVVLDGTDNFAAKFRLNDACARASVPLVQASLYQFEGQVHVFDPRDPGSGCLRCLWPDAPVDGCVGTCAEVGVLGVVPGVIGAIQAVQAIQLIAGIGDPLRRDLLVFDLDAMRSSRIERPKLPGCPGCQGLPQDEEELEVGPDDGLDAFAWIDIREDWEREADPFPAVAMPMSCFDPGALAPGGRYLLICAHGVRSMALAHHLRAAGIQAWSLRGGLAQTPQLRNGPG